MNHRLIVRRYGQGLGPGVDLESDFQSCLEQLRALVQLINSNPILNYALTSAFIPVRQKKQMVEEIFKRQDFDLRLVRLLRLLTEKGKMVLLPEILDQLPEVWAEEKGIEVF